MTSLRNLRETVADFFGKIVGSRHEMPVHFQAQKDSIGKQGDIRALPLQASCPIQIMDTASAHFGDFWFMPGYDAPGSKPIKPKDVC